MALTQEDLQAIGALMDSKLEPIQADIQNLKAGQASITTRLDTMQEDIEQIKEDTEITRDTTNGLGEWAELAAVALKIRYPIKE